MNHEDTPRNTEADASGFTPDSVEDEAIVRVETPAGDVSTERAAADEIFRTAQFEGEALRMGQVLRRVRETLGLDLAEISRRSRLRQNFLMSIERMELGLIPKGYLSVYLRAYGKELGIPVNQLVERYTRETGAVEDVRQSAPVPKMGDIAPPKPKWPMMAAAAVVLVALGGGGIAVKALLSPAPELAPAPPVVAAVNGARESLFQDASQRPLPTNLPLELVALRQGWLEVRGADGTIFLSRVVAKDESYFPRLDAGWTVSAKDGGAFEWRAGDIVVGPLGPDGAAVFSASVDEKLSLAADMAAPTVAANGGAKATR